MIRRQSGNAMVGDILIAPGVNCSCHERGVRAEWFCPAHGKMNERKLELLRNATDAEKLMAHLKNED